MLTGRILLCHIITLSLVCFFKKMLIKSLDFMRHNNLFFFFLLDVHFLVNCTTRISTTKPSGMRCYGYKMIAYHLCVCLFYFNFLHRLKLGYILLYIKHTGYIVYFATVASFSWLTVYCFDYYRIFR